MSNSATCCWFQPFIRLAGVRLAWDAKHSTAQIERTFSCFLFWWRPEVALDFKERFQIKLGFCPGMLCTVVSELSPLKTIFYFLSHPATWSSFWSSLTDFPFSPRNCALFQASLPNDLFQHLNIQLWSLFASLLDNRIAVCNRFVSPSMWLFHSCSVYSCFVSLGFSTDESCLSFTVKFGY